MKKTVLVKMLSGAYGHEENGIVVAKTAADEPFYANEDRALELEKLGYMEIVHEQGASAEISAASLGDKKLDDLKEIAEEHGIKFKVGMKKTDLVKQIETARQAEEPDQQEVEEPTPSFDAADAVV